MNIHRIELSVLLSKAAKAKDQGANPLVLFTSNLATKADGQNPMGRGTAKVIATQYPFVPREYGNELVKHPPLHRPRIWRSERYPFIGAFAVKPPSVVVGERYENIVPHMRGNVIPGRRVQGWMSLAQLPLIQESWAELSTLRDSLWATQAQLPWSTLWVPYLPGTGNGGLNPMDVLPLCPDWPELHFYHH